jgi:hypothetical protein
MPNASTTRIALNICIGLVVGAVLPIALFLVLAVVDSVVINVAYSRFDTDIGLAISQLYVLLIPVETISLLFLAKFNKTLVVAALPTAIIVTAYVSYVTAKFVPFAPG